MTQLGRVYWLWTWPLSHCTSSGLETGAFRWLQSCTCAVLGIIKSLAANDRILVVIAKELFHDLCPWLFPLRSFLVRGTRFRCQLFFYSNLHVKAVFSKPCLSNSDDGLQEQIGLYMFYFFSKVLNYIKLLGLSKMLCFLSRFNVVEHSLFSVKFWALWMLLILNFYFGTVIFAANDVALTLNVGFPSLLCFAFALLEFMRRAWRIRFNVYKISLFLKFCEGIPCLIKYG